MSSYPTKLSMISLDTASIEPFLTSTPKMKYKASNSLLQEEKTKRMVKIDSR